MSFRSYVMSRNIYDDKQIFKSKIQNFTDEILTKHIYTLCDLHGRLRGCTIPINNMINKMVDDFKISRIFLERDLRRYKDNYHNEFEYSVGKFGDKMLRRIETVLDVIENNDYENVILRSIKSKEISVYNVFPHQVYADQNSKIYVKNIDEFCENIIEYDYIKFLTKIKRTGIDIDFVKICTRICELEKLDINSCNIIMACVSFPYEFIRVISKYRDLGENLSDYSGKVDFDMVLKKDGESLV